MDYDCADDTADDEDWMRRDIFKMVTSAGQGEGLPLVEDAQLGVGEVHQQEWSKNAKCEIQEVQQGRQGQQQSKNAKWEIQHAAVTFFSTTTSSKSTKNATILL